jgi:hypothetical protein
VFQLVLQQLHALRELLVVEDEAVQFELGLPQRLVLLGELTLMKPKSHFWRIEYRVEANT